MGGRMGPGEIKAHFKETAMKSGLVGICIFLGRLGGEEAFGFNKSVRKTKATLVACDAMIKGKSKAEGKLYWTNFVTGGSAGKRSKKWQKW